MKGGNQGISLRKNFTWVLFSNVINGLVKWGIVISIAKLSSPYLLGQYTLATGLVLPVFAFLNFHLRIVYITSSDQQKSFADFLGLRIVTSFTAIVCIAVVAWFMKYDTEVFMVVVSYSFVRGAEALSDILYAPVQKSERMKLMSISIIGRSLISFAVVLITIGITGSLVMAICLMALWETAVSVFVDYKIAAHFLPGTSKKIRFAHLGGIVRQSYPLGLAMGITILNSSIPRFILDQFQGIKEVGFFGAIQYFYVASGLIITAINSASIPRLTKYFNSERNDQFNALLRKLFLLGISMGGAGVLFIYFWAPIILKIFYTKEYVSFSTELVLIVIAAAFQYLVAIAASAILSMGRYWNMVAVLSAGAGCTITFGYLLIPNHGVLGAVWSMVISAIIQLVVILYFLFQLQKNMKTVMRPSF